MQTGKEVKLFLSADNMILCITDPQIPPVETISKTSNVSEYRISLCSSLAFLHTNNKYIEKEIMGTLLSAIVSKKIKYLR